MGMYLYVLASAIAVFGILFFYKKNIDKVKEDPENAGAAMNNFFIGAAMSESIPIVLLVVALLNPEPAADLSAIMVPVIFIVMLMAVSIFFIFMQFTVGVPPESKQAVNQMSFIAFPMAKAIPVISIIFLVISVT